MADPPKDWKGCTTVRPFAVVGEEQAVAVCAEPGCPEHVDRGRCEKHRKVQMRDASRRRNRQAEGTTVFRYNTRAWRTARRQQLRQSPECVCGTSADVVDHVIPRRLLLAAGIADPDTPAWLQSLCKLCHDRKTQTVDVPILRQLDAGADPLDLVDRY